MVSVIRQATRVFIARELSPAARSAKLAEVARQGVADLVASGRASPRYRVFVDGREGADEATVKPTDGVILYDFSYTAEIVGFAIGFLKARSPVGSGRYRDSFMVSINGRPVPAAQVNPNSIPADAEITIYNKQPYSRKIDVQRAGIHTLKYSVPPGLFDDAVRALRRRFGNLITAKRLYAVTFPDQYVRETGKGKTRGKGSRVQSPGIVITPQG